MFDQLSEKLMASFKKLKGSAQITESNIEDAIKDIRMSLLEADVHFKVVKQFIDQVKAKALGAEVLTSVTPGQQFVKIVHDELVDVLGKEAVRLEIKGAPGVVMLVGLQGTGKTTSAAKLGIYVREKLGKKVGLVSVDVYRPAAMDQLKTLAKTNNLLVYDSQPSDKPESILEKAKAWAKAENIEVVILDTAGRLQLDNELMAELQRLKAILPPTETLLVADAMLGQQSVDVATEFNKTVGLTGLVLTKVDGDARGGAALSIRTAVGVPIKFLGVGEKVANLEVFHPDRLASRLLDRGDILTLVEKAQEVIDEGTAKETAKKIAKNQFTFEEFLKQIQMMKKMGGMESILKMIPGMGQISKQIKNMAPPDKEMKKIEAIIHSMTLQERREPKVLNGSRRLRIANGSGTQVSDVNKLVKQFEDSKKMMAQMMKMGRGSGGRFPF
jgi:signal recognition particle subunit SRP54